MWSRRAFLRAAGTGFALSLTGNGADALAATDAVYATAARDQNGNFIAALVSENGTLISTTALPGRGHDVTRCPITGKYVAFARRPGTFAVVFDPNSGVAQTITSPDGRHFYGHGVFTNDGKLMFATENEIDTASGKLGIYDATDSFRRIGEWDTGGIGPHDLLLGADGRLLCVANGGIETHPDFGRQKLNIPTMQPSIVWIEIESGHIIARHELPPEQHKLSTRHLAVGEGGRIYFGAQDQGDLVETMPLVGHVHPHEELGWLAVPASDLRLLKGYVGSIAFNQSGEICVTSPEGGIALVLDQNGSVLSRTSSDAICGAASDRSGFALSNGLGDWLTTGGETSTGPQRLPIQFDNHLFTADA
ncbi:MAG: DUF1513 domain-containing protein [Hyphomicrobiaceae bacterium]|nr:DUF1513 domain-containing protein [Hyphomicrobiaceae bacterium]MCC0022957.1 DUF1513 domain-containing protein [Hyphomicrobiaceae bacterium]